MIYFNKELCCYNKGLLVKNFYLSEMRRMLKETHEMYISHHKTKREVQHT